eukprot:CAMPEP_0115322830 /NCGR_PEP_ID=MMETSP0270-20121206/81609_1 /TAXON_ID=71861 /ORGANISM="Scrippsiella trochoidea, Strain CCMP3099" /LENGTH=43 /DNA_ID= /DNA_START= /DNA_END= /DNA_ORIENTATION=
MEVLDIQSGSWEHVPPMSGYRSSAASAVLGHHLYVCGGILRPA